MIFRKRYLKNPEKYFQFKAENAAEIEEALGMLRRVWREHLRAFCEEMVEAEESSKHPQQAWKEEVLQDIWRAEMDMEKDLLSALRVLAHGTELLLEFKQQLIEYRSEDELSMLFQEVEEILREKNF